MITKDTTKKIETMVADYFEGMDILPMHIRLNTSKSKQQHATGKNAYVIGDLVSQVNELLQSEGYNTQNAKGFVSSIMQEPLSNVGYQKTPYTAYAFQIE